jgi:hypothetical protein
MLLFVIIPEINKEQSAQQHKANDRILIFHAFVFIVFAICHRPMIITQGMQNTYGSFRTGFLLSRKGNIWHLDWPLQVDKPLK